MSINSPQSYPQRFPSVAKRNSSRAAKLKGIKRSWQRCLQYFYWRLVRLKGRPESLARGLACGVFAGLFPIFGFQIIIGVFLAVIFRGNKILAAAGTWISNPVTYVPIYAFNYQVGKFLLNQHDVTNVSLQSQQQVTALGSEMIVTLLLGCCAVGLICSILSYFLGLWLICRVRRSYQLRSHRRYAHF